MGDKFSISRRHFLQAGAALGGAMLLPGVMQSAWAAGSDKPEQSTVRVGFIPLTDCAPIAIASLKGFDKKYGITLVPTKEASWAAVRDKLIAGELDAAHILYGLLYGLELGIAGKPHAMANLMTLNRNGQAITLSSDLREKGVTDLGGLKRLIGQRAPGSYTFAHTFPTGTHAMWLYYWLASGGIDPFTDVRTVVVPPPQMVMNMRIGNMVGFCVGEPWNARAINDRIGFTAATSQAIWPEHPEKILGTRSEWVERNPNTARALVAAVLDAARWIDASEENKRETARILAKRAWLNTKEQYLTGRMLGEYDNGLGQRWQDAHPIRFYDQGEVSFPWLSDGMWFLTQFRRWGLLKTAPDYQAVAGRINRIDVWKEAAQAVGGISTPAALMRSSTLIDGTVWTGADPEGYARASRFNVRGHEMKHAHSTQPVIATEKTPGEVIVLPPVQVRRPTPPVRRWLRETVQRLLPPLLGLGLLLLCWQLAAINGKGFPTPLSTLDSALTLFADPFYQDGPNDMGIGWNVLASLQRVAVGFGLAALVGIPLGFLIGRSLFFARMFNPLIALLRPVSPLAWLPIGLLLFQKAEPASSWTIFICSIWPMVINTAEGVRRIPQDYLNVARVLQLSEWTVMRRILFPAVLPAVLTGVRLSIGIAWLVIVAAEMLTGGLGIGFWIWNEWNNLNVENIIIAIVIIGVVGLLLEQGLMLIARRFSWQEK
ncbi:NrtA [Raoultella ornithinolytica]|nr:NrtA [Raoultella ornithinolytica]